LYIRLAFAKDVIIPAETFLEGEIKITRVYFIIFTYIFIYR
jgi:hypothetical protein